MWIISQLVFNISVSLSIYLLVSVSFSLIYYPAKFFDIAHAAIIALGAYLVFFFTNNIQIPFFLAVLLAILLSVGIGLMCEFLVYRQMRKQKASSLSFLIASLGLYVILQNCISLYFGDDTKIINTAEVVVGHQIFGAYITSIQILIIVISVILFIVVNLFLFLTKSGKSIRAVSSNPELCNIYGISPNKIILISFTVGYALAAIAGILYAMDMNMTPTFGFNLLLYGVVVMIIGGVGSTKNLIAGAFILATAQNLAVYYIDTKWMDAITFIILILFLIWRPLGFSGKKLKKVEV